MVDGGDVLGDDGRESVEDRSGRNLKDFRLESKEGRAEGYFLVHRITVGSREVGKSDRCRGCPGARKRQDLGRLSRRTGWLTSGWIRMVLGHRREGCRRAIRAETGYRRSRQVPEPCNTKSMH